MKRRTNNIIIISVLITVITVGCYIGCKAKKHNEITEVIPTKNVTLSTNIRFNFEYVASIVSNHIDTSYYIKYDDPDCFDYDNLAHYCGMDEWYGSYIFIHIEDNIISEFLHDYITYTSDVDYTTKRSLSKKYCINEIELIDSTNLSSFIWTIKKI